VPGGPLVRAQGRKRRHLTPRHRRQKTGESECAAIRPDQVIFEGIHLHFSSLPQDFGEMSIASFGIFNTLGLFPQLRDSEHLSQLNVNPKNATHSAREDISFPRSVEQKPMPNSALADASCSQAVGLVIFKFLSVIGNIQYSVRK
jgi:hypothetical protein